MTAIVSDYGSRRESINRMISKIADRTSPLVARHLSLNEPAKAIKWEWVDKALVGMMDKLSAALTSSTTTILTLHGGTDVPKRYIAGVSRLLIESETLLVNSIITTVTNMISLCVTRGHRSSTASSHVVESQVRILNSQVEGFTAGRDDSQKGTRQFNYTMIFERELILSGSSIAVDAVGNENKLDQQAADLTPELIKEMEGAFLYSDRYANADLSDRSAGGFLWHAQNRGAANTDMNTNQIDFDLFEDVIKTYLQNGGDARKLCALVSITQQQYINDLKEARIIGGGQSQSEKNIDNFVSRYDFGSKAQVEIMYSSDLRDDEVFFYQKDKVKIKPLQGRTWTREPLAKDGDSVKEMILGEYTFEFQNSKELLFYYYNLAV